MAVLPKMHSQAKEYFFLDIMAVIFCPNRKVVRTGKRSMLDEGRNQGIDIRQEQITSTETPAEEVEEERARQELHTDRRQHDGPNHYPQFAVKD